MKKLYFILIVVCFTMAACNEKETVANTQYDSTSTTPVVSDTFSWAAYNWPDRVLAYFYSHEEEMMLHKGDTIKLTGWIVGNDIDDVRRNWDIPPYGDFHLTSDPGHTFDSSIGMFYYYSVFMEHLNEWWPNQLYVIGIFNPFTWDTNADYKSQTLVQVRAINIDTNPN